MSGAVEKLLFTYLWNRCHQQIPGIKLIQIGAIYILLCQNWPLFDCWKDIWCWKLPGRVATSENDRLHMYSLCIILSWQASSTRVHAGRFRAARVARGQPARARLVRVEIFTGCWRHCRPRKRGDTWQGPATIPSANRPARRCLGKGQGGRDRRTVEPGGKRGELLETLRREQHTRESTFGYDATVEVSNFEPGWNFGCFRARSVAPSNELRTKKWNRVFNPKGFLQPSFLCSFL